jgi:hypothetical protein
VNDWKEDEPLHQSLPQAGEVALSNDAAGVLDVLAHRITRLERRHPAAEEESGDGG